MTRPALAAVPPATAPVSAQAVIEIRDLHKNFGPLEVLRGIDMTAPRSHVISLIGSSGSGKSTLLRCCNLLEDSQQGEIRNSREESPPPSGQGGDRKEGRCLACATGG